MTESVRCPSCRGAKKVPKLGGMIGECNTCSGKGSILASDKPKPAINVEPEISQNDIIDQVADCVPASDISPYKDTTIAGTLDVKVDGKKALYKRKKG